MERRSPDTPRGSEVAASRPALGQEGRGGKHQQERAWGAEPTTCLKRALLSAGVGQTRTATEAGEGFERGRSSCASERPLGT